MKIDSRQKLLLIVTAAVLVVFFGDKVVFTRLTGLWNRRAEEVVKLRNQIERGNRLIADEANIRARWASMRTNTLPTDQSLAQEQALKAVENWSQESGASMNGFTTQWKTDADDHQTLICRVDASGSLWALARFIYDIESGPVALKLESLDLSSRDNTGQQLNLALQISGLVLTPQQK